MWSMTITRPAPNSQAQRAAILRLSAVEAAGGVRIAENAADRGRRRVGLVAIAEQSLLAEMALPTGDVERHQHMVADLQILDLGADFLDDAGEFVAEGLADPRVGHHAVI